MYEILRQRVTKPDPRITYAELAEQLRDLSDDFDHIYHRSRELYPTFRTTTSQLWRDFESF